MKPKVLLSIFLTSMLALALIIACGGGGGGGDGTSTTPAGQTGSVALFITDAPTTDYDEIVLSVSKVTLIPYGSESKPREVTIFEPDNSVEVHLLNLRDQEFLLNVRHNVPAGRYEKVRLYVDAVDVIGGNTCDDKFVKLPSGKLDLNPKGTFEIKPGEVKSIKIDVDAEKSTLLVEAGNSGKCILRPVAFVEIGSFVERCPRILSGEIVTLFDDNEGPGFTMRLDKGGGLLDVLLNRGIRDTAIFDDRGMFAEVDDLKTGQTVKVRGRLNRNADLLASVVVIGEVFTLDGTIAEPVDNPQFDFEIDPGQPLYNSVDEKITVQLDNASLILEGCDTEVEFDAIQAGARATVIGKVDLGQNVLFAVAVLLREPILAGDLLDIQPSYDGYELTVRTPDNQTKKIFLPPGEPILLQNDGEVSFKLLSKLVDCREEDPVKVKIILDPDKTAPTALEVRVQSEKVFGIVKIVYEDRSILLESTEEVLINVLKTATIFKIEENESGSNELMSGEFDNIRTGDELSAFGLRSCKEYVDYESFVAFALIFRQVEPEF